MLILHDLDLDVDAFSVIEHIRLGLGMSVRAFMQGAGLSRDAYYKWRDGDNGAFESSLHKLENAYQLKFIRDTLGNVTGVEKISLSDIDNGTSESDIPLIGTSEQDMVERYEELARRHSLPHWEDLDDRTRADIKTEMDLARMEMERTLLATQSTILKMMRNKRE